jgi:hypothetical protein
LKSLRAAISRALPRSRLPGLPLPAKWFGMATGWIKRTWSANASWLALAFIGIAAALGFVTVVQTIKLDDRHFSFQWGNAAEWFAAVGTVGTLAWAVGQGSYLMAQANRAAGLAMAFKLIEAAQSRWRAVNAPHLVALVRAGAQFENGELIERPDNTTEEEAA